MEKLIDHQNPYIAARAIWLLPHLGKAGKKKTVELLNSSDRNQRLVAYRSLRRVEENMLPYAKKMAKDSDTGIRRDVALSLRSIPFEKSKDLFVGLAKGYDRKDKNYLEAIGLGAAGKENQVWKHLRNSLGFADSSEVDGCLCPHYLEAVNQVMPSLTLSTVQKTATSPSNRENLPSNRLPLSITTKRTGCFA